MKRIFHLAILGLICLAPVMVNAMANTPPSQKRIYSDGFVGAFPHDIYGYLFTPEHVMAIHTGTVIITTSTFKASFSMAFKYTVHQGTSVVTVSQQNLNFNIPEQPKKLIGDYYGTIVVNSANMDSVYYPQINGAYNPLYFREPGEVKMTPMPDGSYTFSWSEMLPLPMGVMQAIPTANYVLKTTIAQ